jgi:Mg2+-importing ATPase
MVSMALVTPLLPFLPLAAKQILLNNFLSDLPSMAISQDEVDPEHVARPRRWNLAEIRRFMIVFGLISSVFDLLAFALLLLAFHAKQPVFQTAWFVISVLTELAVVLVLRTNRAAFRSRPSRLLVCLTATVALLTLLLPYSGELSFAFGFVPLSPVLMAAALAIVGSYIATTEAAKRVFFHPER